MRLFYPDPDRPPPPTESVLMTAERSRQVSGRVVFSGAGWYRPDYRKKDLGTILARVSRALAYTRWKTDATATLMVEGVFKAGSVAALATPTWWALDKEFRHRGPTWRKHFGSERPNARRLVMVSGVFGSDVDSQVHNQAPISLG